MTNKKKTKNKKKPYIERDPKKFRKNLMTFRIIEGGKIVSEWQNGAPIDCLTKNS